MTAKMAREHSGSLQFQDDSILFQGPKVPREVQKMMSLLSKVTFEKFRKILQGLACLGSKQKTFVKKNIGEVVCNSFQNVDVDAESFESLADDSFTEEQVMKLASGLYTIVKATLRQPSTAIKEDSYKAELFSYKFPKNFIDEIVKSTFGKSRTDIEKCLLGDRIRFPGLDSLKWRVDVAISTSSLNRVLVPTVLMEMKSTDGSVKSFEVSLSKFNELEYDVAYILKEMEDLEKRSILKIE